MTCGEHVGLRAWAHVGGSARRRRPSRDQFAQVLATAGSLSAEDHVPRRIVVATPRTEPLARNLAIGLAAEVVALGGRALLVDADADRPVLSARLGGVGRPGLLDIGDDVELAQVIRRVNPLAPAPQVARSMVGADAEHLRFVPAGRFRRSAGRRIPLGALDLIDPEVTIIVLAPPTLGEWPTATLLGWCRRAGAVGDGRSHDHPRPRGRCGPGALVLVRSHRSGAARWVSRSIPTTRCRSGHGSTTTATSVWAPAAPTRRTSTG